MCRRFFCSSAFGVGLELGATVRGATLERAAAAGARIPWKFVRCSPLGTMSAVQNPGAQALVGELAGGVDLPLGERFGVLLEVRLHAQGNTEAMLAYPGNTFTFSPGGLFWGLEFGLTPSELPGRARAAATPRPARNPKTSEPPRKATSPCLGDGALFAAGA